MVDIARPKVMIEYHCYTDEATMSRILALLYMASVAAVLAHESESQLPLGHLHCHEELEGHLHSGWESRYFSEGRDSLDGDSLWSISLETGWRHLVTGVWYGVSPDQDYDEVQLSAGLAQVIGDYELYVAYTHLRFPFDDSHDNEIGAGVTWTGLPLDVAISADVYHSLDAAGEFWEFAVDREFKVSDGLSLEGVVLFGVNQGYVADGHDGANNLALRLGAEYSPMESFAVTAHLAYSWALDRDPNLPGDEALTDFFHGGIGLQWSF